MKAKEVYAQLNVLMKVIETKIKPNDEMLVILSGDEKLKSNQIAVIMKDDNLSALAINIKIISNAAAIELEVIDEDEQDCSGNSSIPS